ncbi:MAG: hypothetical protein HQM16_07555 [Deltaproteobacteria bacterium]|nr:hypothetical protein [Deltaproteobacteria bacterium]
MAQTGKTVLVGVIRDPAFQFYYEENLEALREQGATIIFFDSLRDKAITPVDLLYIGGGFPEVHAASLEANKDFRDSIRFHAGRGMPVYGECGAVMYLGRTVCFNGETRQMCGVFDVDFELAKKPVGHGYVEAVVSGANPFFPRDERLKGHEFHYSRPVEGSGSNFQLALSLQKGFGYNGASDGLVKNNVFAAYTHFHAGGFTNWARLLVAKAGAVGYAQGAKE